MGAFARVASEVTYSLGDAFSGIGYAAIMFGILAGGAILWYLLTLLLEYALLYSERRQKYVLVEKTAKAKVWRKSVVHWWSSCRHLIVQITFFLGLALIVWIGASVIGFNVWSSAVASLGLSVIVTYSFATPLGLYGSSLFVNGAGLVTIGEHVEFHGTGTEWAGVVVAIHSMQVELVRFNDQTRRGEMIMVPISDFLSRMRKTVWKEDYEPTNIVYRDADDFKKQMTLSTSEKPRRKTGRTAPAASAVYNKYAEQNV